MSADNTILERKQRLSESLLWRLGRRYFDSQGPAAWSSGTVPFRVTSNPFIAQSYAHLIAGYLSDCLSGRHLAGGCAIDPEAPIYICELATGSGCFSQLLLGKLDELLGDSALSALRLRYVMTDFTEQNLRAYRSAPRFKPFFDVGRLDLALFDMEKSDRLTLLCSGESLAPGTVKNPLIVLANYAFDSIGSDLFRVSGGQLFAQLLTVRSAKATSIETLDPSAIRELKREYSSEPASADYYGDPAFDDILAHYRRALDKQTFLFPIGPLRCVRRLLEIADNRMLLLSSDIGNSEIEQQEEKEADPLRFYGGPVLGVNYHALAYYFRSRGGQALLTSQRGLPLQTAALWIGGRGPQFFNTALAFKLSVDSFGPGNLHSLIKGVRSQSPEVTLEFLIELLHLSRWEPSLFMAFAQNLPAQIHFSKTSLLEDLRRGIKSLWQNFSELDGDLPFELARTHLAMNEPEEACRLGELSLQRFGEHPSTLFNLGLCHYRRGALGEALRCFERAVEKQPDFAAAKLWRARALSEFPLPPDLFLPTVSK